jgi:putative drug exporter of the RND superfamily
MELLGDRNWWLPGWLKKALPNITVEVAHDAPAPSMATANSDFD